MDRPDPSAVRCGRCIFLNEACSIPYGVTEPTWNMAIDEAIFTSMMNGRGLPTVRLYTWTAPAITIGRFQIDPFSTPNHPGSVPVARRITGGRGILHGNDLTVTVSLPMGWLEPTQTGSVSAIYRYLATAFIDAFRCVGIAAEMGDCPSPGKLMSAWNCMEISSRADLVDAVSGVKLMGSALRRCGAWVLQQSSIPLGREDGFDSLMFSDRFIGALGKILQATFQFSSYDPALLSAAEVICRSSP